MRQLLYATKLEFLREFGISFILPGNILITTTYRYNSRCKTCNYVCILEGQICSNYTIPKQTLEEK
jgi:hypothetical protein